ncbi:MAG: diguanylate cyclase [Coriobacteriia bacterium]|nr:diguanylate cyclase [Coriobacteriia bacterium]
MKYSRFEALVSGLGAIAVLSALALSARGALVIEEVVAEVLLLFVLFAAVHWGRNGGFIAALGASILYLLARVPLVAAMGGLTWEVTSIVLVRVLSYGLVGIVGGELCSRIRYIFAKLEDSSSLDEWSQVFNQRFIMRAFESALGQHGRYQTPYSVVVLELADVLLTDLRSSKQRSIIRGVATHIRNDIRLVDEAGRLDDGRFMVVLPHTPRDGALIVGERLHRGICNVVGAREESISVNILGTPEDADELVELRRGLVAQLDQLQATVSTA